MRIEEEREENARGESRAPGRAESMSTRLPSPPLPVIVTSHVSASRRLSIFNSVSRPINGVEATGKGDSVIGRN